METENEKKPANKLLIILLVLLPIAGGAGIWYYFVQKGANYLTTENARITTTLFPITPSMAGTLERFNIREGQFVRENEVLGWIENGESFRSPVAGLVVRTFAEQNQAVSPLVPLAVIADTANLHIQANIEEGYVARIEVGQAVSVSIDALGRRQFNGYVAEIGKITDAALTGEMMSFTTTGRFTKVVQLLPVKINIIDDDINLSSIIGLNAGVRIRLRSTDVSNERTTSEGKNKNAETINGISVRGVVESVEKRRVFSTLGHKIRQVYVEEGDAVRSGQILALLDDGDLMPTVAHQQAENALRNARMELETRRFTHENNQILHNSGSFSREELRLSQDALNYAQNKYASARTLLNAAVHNLRKQSIRSPIDGVITAVFAKEGAVGAGLLFVVEDSRNLKITTRFREYDINKIRTGMSVIISSDASENEYAGIISRINPAAVKDAQGETVSDPVVEFEAEVAVISPNTDLRIGMNARLLVVLE